MRKTDPAAAMVAQRILEDRMRATEVQMTSTRTHTRMKADPVGVKDGNPGVSEAAHARCPGLTTLRGFPP